MKNKKIILSSYPSGMPTEEDFKIEESEVNELTDNEFLVETLYLSVDPFLRMLMNPSDESNAASRDEGPITDIGKVMGKAMASLKGKADGSLISKLVKDLLR